MSAEVMRKLMESMSMASDKTGPSCGCGPECKCGGTCGGQCGDENCPCECGQHTGIGVNECGLSITENNELTESSVYEESKFISIMNWFMAPSGMPAKHQAADILREKYPEAEPWKWTSGYSVYLRAKKEK